jgi:NAD(P)-dependent dehydrogenase (short-subunit alcohol dehydrogenase family)
MTENTTSNLMRTGFAWDSTAAEVIAGIDLTGKRAIVTGASSGIGVETARALASAGAEVTLAVRNVAAGERSAAEIVANTNGAAVRVGALDLADLDSVRRFVAGWEGPLNLLINNAGVMALPYRTTADGFEMHLGANHLGHFALTGLLLDSLLAAGGARVVTVSAGLYRLGRIRFDDLQWQHGYRKWLAYGQSKLANLLFTFELQRRAETAGAALTSLACHPGYAATNLQAAGPKMLGSALRESLMGLANRLLAQSAAMGALPTLYAAASADAHGGDYIGPDGFAEGSGHPKKVGCNARARDRDVAARLWDVSERLTGVRYAALDPR